MSFITYAAVAAVILLHVSFLILEMFLWTTPAGCRIHGMPRPVADRTKTLAANQGLYNGFLAAGLAWSLMLGNGGHDIRVFFLACVILAGVFGAATVKSAIFWVQGAPALLALGLTLASSRT